MQIVPSIERIFTQESTFNDKLNEVALLTPDELDERIAMESYEVLLQPEKNLPNLIDGLSEIYRDRTVIHRMPYMGNTEEVIQFGTRDRTESYLEELYTIIDKYGPNNKGWQSRSYILDRFAVDELTGEKRRLKICIEPSVEVRTYTFDDTGHMKLLGDDEAYMVMGRFVGESLLSASLMADESLAEYKDLCVQVRTAEERILANMDAKTMLNQYHEELGLMVASIPDLRTGDGQKMLHDYFMSLPNKNANFSVQQRRHDAFNAY